MTTAATLKKITLSLARTKQFPNGSIRHGYELVAPLDRIGKINPDAWKAHRSACTVRRFWGDEPIEKGFLVHRPGGVKGATWGFEYDASTHDDDEAGYRFGEHAFEVGEYVSIRDQDGEMLTFKVVEISAP
ncbi:MAG: hypothetical protein ACRC7C_17740 [Beijerinckiaceae bacterium]